jgi:hypothetical protein
LQDERLREDAKQLLRVAYELRVVDGTREMQVNLTAAAEHRELGPDSPHLAMLVDFMEVVGWIEVDLRRPVTLWATPTAGSPRAALRCCVRCRALGG